MSAPRARGPIQAIGAGLARRRAARAPRVIVREERGAARHLAPDDAEAGPLLAAAAAVLAAAGRR